MPATHSLRQLQRMGRLRMPRPMGSPPLVRAAGLMVLGKDLGSALCRGAAARTVLWEGLSSLGACRFKRCEGVGGLNALSK